MAAVIIPSSAGVCAASELTTFNIGAVLLHSKSLCKMTAAHMYGGILTDAFAPCSRGSSLWVVQVLPRTSATQQRAQCNVQSATSWSGGRCGLSSASSSHTLSPCSHVPTTVAAQCSCPTSPCESQRTVMRHLRLNCCTPSVSPALCQVHLQGTPACLCVLRLLCTRLVSCSIHDSQASHAACLQVHHPADDLIPQLHQ